MPELPIPYILNALEKPAALPGGLYRFYWLACLDDASRWLKPGEEAFLWVSPLVGSMLMFVPQMEEV